MHIVTPPKLAWLKTPSALLAARQRYTSWACPNPRFSPFRHIKIVMMLCISLGTGAFLLGAMPPITAAGQAVPNGNCTLIVPADPLTAGGLATPYQLVATNPQMGPCNEANPAQSAFVQGAIFDPATSRIFVYDPLVIDKDTRPAIVPVAPMLPKNAIVALWFGFNGNVLTLSRNNGFNQGRCVDGVDNSPFGQFAYCNAPAFFAAANQAIRDENLFPPPLGFAKNGLTCPTTRDFSVVDQDQSDNVTTSYLVANGRIAQNTAANRAKLKNFTVLVNPSDNKLLVGFIDPALGCNPWMAPNLADNKQPTTALPLNELQALVRQRPPVALVPAGDPMVLVNGQPNLAKLNSYRIGVDQPPVESLAQANTVSYCLNLLNIGAPRLFFDSPLTRKAPSPIPAMANNLFTFLAQRFNTTWGPNGLNCMGLLGNKPSPITVISKGGVAVDATIKISNPRNGK